jgi:hypothetical protein
VGIPSLSPALAVMVRDSLRSGHYTLIPVTGSQYGGTLTIPIPLAGVLATIPTADPTATFWSKILKQILGGQSIGGYSAAAVTGGTPSTVGIDNAILSSIYSAGGAIVTKATDGTYMLAVLKTVTDGGVSDHELETLAPMAANPDGSDVSWGAINSYASDDAPVAMTIELQTQNAAGKIVCGGCIAQTVKIPLGPRVAPMIEVTFVINEIHVISGAALSATGYTLPLLSPPTKAAGGRATLGSSTVRFHDLTLELSQTLEPEDDHNSSQGVADVTATERKQLLTYTRLLTGAPTDLDALTTRDPIVVAFGTQPGRMFGFAMPAPVLIAAASLEANGNRWAQTFKCEAGQYTGDSASTGPGNSAFRAYQA